MGKTYLIEIGLYTLDPDNKIFLKPNSYEITRKRNIDYYFLKIFWNNNNIFKIKNWKKDFT